jgi:hypothetical protein
MNGSLDENTLHRLKTALRGPVIEPQDKTRAYYDALHPYSAGGAYVNFMMDEGEDRVKATYRGNYDRLVEIKTKYDPDNLFRVNQNIKPLAR